MKTQIALLVLALSIITACGKESESARLSALATVTKCGSQVYVHDDRTVELPKGAFQRVCVLNNGIVERWNQHLIQSGIDTSCGFNIYDNKLVTNLNKELDFTRSADVYVPCEGYGF